jgi:hypothetical protein
VQELQVMSCRFLHDSKLQELYNIVVWMLHRNFAGIVSLGPVRFVGNEQKFQTNTVPTVTFSFAAFGMKESLPGHPLESVLHPQFSKEKYHLPRALVFAQARGAGKQKAASTSTWDQHHGQNR